MICVVIFLYSSYLIPFLQIISFAILIRIHIQTSHYQSLTEAKQEHDLDGIIISTPTPTHASLIIEAAQVGLSIFTEKPIDETSSKIRQLYSVTNGHGVKLCCGFQRRFDPSYLLLYNQLNNSSANEGSGIGKPLTASIFFGDHPIPSRTFLLQGGGNIISDCSAHDVDFIRWTLQDEVVSVYATGTSSDYELREAGVIDNATMIMKFSKGTLKLFCLCLYVICPFVIHITSLIPIHSSNIHTNVGTVVTLILSRAATYGYDQRIEIFGTKGLASLSNPHSTNTQLSNSNGIHLSKLQYSFPQRFDLAFNNELDLFADVLLSTDDNDDGGSTIEWPVKEEDCIAVQRICDAALASCESGEVVRL